MTQPNSPVNRTAIDTLVWLLDDAFGGQSDHSLLSNLKGLEDGDWTALFPGAGRTTAEILEHVGWCKWMYEDYAFGPGTLRGDQPPVLPPDGTRSRPTSELLAWLTEGHQRWVASVRARLDDTELDRDRLTNWGEYLPTRVIIRIMLEHDVYHAGEINHLRCLLKDTDRWPDYGSE